MHYETRKGVLKYDDVINTQRSVIFSQRRDIMFSDSVAAEIEALMDDKNCQLLEKFISNGVDFSLDNCDLNGLNSEINRLYGINSLMERYLQEDLKPSREKILNFLKTDVRKLMDSKVVEYGKDVMRIIQKHVFLLTIDKLWKDHLYTLDKIKQSIGLRAYGQKDPLLEFKKEAYELFEMLINSINEEVIITLAKIKITLNPYGDEVKLQEEEDTIEGTMASAVNLVRHQQQNLIHGTGKPGSFVNSNRKISRNDKCICGSGKKYKYCCGKF
jgi:preprotein translocase subunit SecA